MSLSAVLLLCVHVSVSFSLECCQYKRVNTLGVALLQRRPSLRDPFVWTSNTTGDGTARQNGTVQNRFDLVTQCCWRSMTDADGPGQRCVGRCAALRAKPSCVAGTVVSDPPFVPVACGLGPFGMSGSRSSTTSQSSQSRPLQGCSRSCTRHATERPAPQSMCCQHPRLRVPVGHLRRSAPQKEWPAKLDASVWKRSSDGVRRSRSRPIDVDINKKKSRYIKPRAARTKSGRYCVPGSTSSMGACHGKSGESTRRWRSFARNEHPRTKPPSTTGGAGRCAPRTRSRDPATTHSCEVPLEGVWVRAAQRRQV